MGSREKIWTPRQVAAINMVNAECGVCGKRYTFAVARARAQLACPVCQQVARQRLEMKRSSRWKAIVSDWLDRWLFKLVIFAALSDLARRVNW